MKRKDNQHRDRAIKMLSQIAGYSEDPATLELSSRIVDAIMDAVKKELMPFKDKYEQKLKKLEAKSQDELTEGEINWLACARFGQNPFNG